MRSWLALLLMMSCYVNVTAAVIKIRPGANSIRNAISTARNGDTLLLQKGMYMEHDIIIPKKLTIRGEGMPVIDAENKYQAFIITADSVTIEGLQVQNTGRSSITDMAGIKVMDAKHVTIRNNRLLNNTYGIYLQNATGCHVTGNTIRSAAVSEINSGNGIHAWKCGQLQISGNTISGHRDGIYFEFVSDSHITANTSFNNMRYGLHFMFSHNNSYTKNIFSNNGAGVAVMYSRGVIMQDNEFVHNWGDAAYGLLLKEISDSRIEHNRFIKNTVGIHMESTTRITTSRNLFQDNGWAMRVQASCSGGTFTANNFIGNSFDVATNGTMMLSIFNNNYWDKYDGYDLNKDNTGDVPYYPVSIYSVITEKIPSAMILYRSLLADIMISVEKAMPSMIPDNLKDDHPLMKKINL